MTTEKKSGRAANEARGETTTADNNVPPSVDAREGATFGTAAALLSANGYRPVPVHAGAKKPIPNGWQNYRFSSGDETNPAWCGGSVGILTGKVVAGVDIDIRQADLSAAIEGLAVETFGPAPRRIGLAPKVLLLYRSPVPFAKIQTREYRLPDDPLDVKKGHRIEILGDGQQFIAFGIHPDTGEPYRWNGGGDPLTIKAEELPPIDEATARAFVVAAEAMLVEAGGLPCGKLRTTDAAREHEPNEALAASDPQQTREQLAAIPNDDVDWDDYAYLLLAAKGAFGSNGSAAFHKWAAKSKKYNREQTASDWSKAKPTRIGAGTIAYLARQAGWTSNVQTEVLLMLASDLKVEPVSWLWRDHIAREKLHLITGTPGTNKTTVAMAVAATITQGGRWPDGTTAQVGTVLIWTGEDGIQDTLMPRLLAHGADMKRVRFVGPATDAKGNKRAFDPARDMEALCVAARNVPEIALLIVDPVVMTVSGDTHKGGDVRRGLAPLVQLAEVMHIAAIGITHFSKNSKDKHPLERVLGSQAFGAAARIVFACAVVGDSPTERIFVRVKNNLGPDGGGFEFNVSPKTVELKWGKTLTGNARELLQAVEPEPEDKGRGSGDMDEAVDWLRGAITDAGGSMPRPWILKAAKEAGFNQSRIERACNRGKFKRTVSGFGKDRKSMWSLPPKPSIGPDGNERF
jgi:hypothetical protein